MVAARFPCDVNVWCIHLRPDCDLVTDVIRQAQPKVTQKEKRTWMTKPVHSDQPPWEMVPKKKKKLGKNGIIIWYHCQRFGFDLNKLIQLTMWIHWRRLKRLSEIWRRFQTVPLMEGNFKRQSWKFGVGFKDGRGQMESNWFDVWRRFRIAIQIRASI